MSIFKRGQADNNLLYLLMAVVIAAIIFFGARSVLSVGKTSETANYITFKSQITSDMKSISSDVGSVRNFTYALPINLREVCFVNTQADPQNGIGHIEIGNYPGIKNSLGSGNNLFLVGDTSLSSFNIGYVSLPNNAFFTCLPMNNGVLKLSLKGTKVGAMVVKTFRVTKDLEFDADGKTVSETTLVSPDGAAMLTVPQGTHVTNPTTLVLVNEIFIELAPQDPSSYADDAVSETYSFGPPGTQFDLPVTLALSYDPNKYSGCPDASMFVFDHTLADGSTEPVNAQSVNCIAHTVSFALLSFSTGFMRTATPATPSAGMSESECPDNQCYEPVYEIGECMQQAVSKGQSDEACNDNLGCTDGTKCRCDGNGNCVAFDLEYYNGCQTAQDHSTCDKISLVKGWYIASSKDCCSFFRLCCPGLSDPLQKLACDTAAYPNDNSNDNCDKLQLLQSLGLTWKTCCENLGECCQ
jgi:hypothetical protein